MMWTSRFKSLFFSPTAQQNVCALAARSWTYLSYNFKARLVLFSYTLIIVICQRKENYDENPPSTPERFHEALL